jgi:hypothetical protein
MFATAYHWTQQQVDDTDADLIDAHLLSWKAEADQRAYDEKLEKLKQKAQKRSG